MDKRIIKTSKYISLLLRHKPEAIGLELDECGWAKIDNLIDLSNEHGQIIDRTLVDQVVITSDKQRFTISDCGCFIRANQGHSISVELNLEPQKPPENLFHGTATRFADSIFKQVDQILRKVKVFGINLEHVGAGDTITKGCD